MGAERGEGRGGGVSARPDFTLHKDEVAMLERLKSGPVVLTLDSGAARILMVHLKVRGLVRCEIVGETFVWTLV